MWYVKKVAQVLLVGLLLLINYTFIYYCLKTCVAKNLNKIHLKIKCAHMIFITPCLFRDT